MVKSSLLVFFLLVLMSGILPAFAEVSKIQLDRDSYFRGESINVIGAVDTDESGLVTIVFRDPTDKFVLLSQAPIQSDNSFEQEIPIDEKFQVSGTYNIAAFILNMTAAKTLTFNFEGDTSNENRQNNSDNISNHETKLPESKINNIILESTHKPLEKQIDEKNLILESEMRTDENQPHIADFVDKTKKPEYYLDRYYGEPIYQSWFDRNYPNLTIEEAVGYSVPAQIEVESTISSTKPENKSDGDAIMMESETFKLQNNSELAQIGLAVGGIAVLFGAVYGIKRKVDNNANHVTLNKDPIQKKLTSQEIYSNPLTILKARLEKGEIVIEEYEALKQEIEKIQ
ncbi:MAG: SHOCT domain-containing protein [Nitrosopumilus sp.]|nr:SHOCT domain-containing protein [Nitrosopumilus sp.]MDH3385695.1 SHOCT domain-containing protein [Nitrosopumilus sp.]